MSSRFSIGRACGHAAIAAIALVPAAPASAAQPAEPAASAAGAQRQTLTVESAIARALDAAPEAAANAARIDALEAARRQAAARPNPTIELLGENIAGTGPYRLIDGVEVTASYSQSIERGGKRAARIALSERDIDVATAEALVQRLDIAQRVQAGYVEALSAEAIVGVAAERLRVARELREEVRRRVREARDPLFAGTRADTRVAEAEVDLELAVHARDAALGRLVALWGGRPDDFQIALEPFFMLDNPPPQLDGAIALVDLAVFEARARRAEAAIAIEQARRIQDPTVRGGVRYLNTTGDVALVGGITIPLARHDTNRGNIERAEAERRRAEAEIEVARATRQRALVLARERVEEARHEAQAIYEHVFPGALRTLEQVRAGFARGGFRHADIDEAQTRLVEVRERMVRATAQYHQALVELDRLTGRFAARLPQEEVR